MSYRFVKITSYYRDYLKHYHAANQHLTSLTYDQQHSHLMQQAYGWSDFFAKNFEPLGVEAFEIVANADLLQRTWANEHGVTASGEEIVFEQIETLRPDVVFFQDTMRFRSTFIKRIREGIPSVKLLFGWCCSPYSKEHIGDFRMFDCMLVCSEHYVDEFRNQGLPVHLLRHGFEESLLARITAGNPFPQTEMIFLGSFIPGSGFHDDRQLFVENLLRSNIPLQVYANITTIGRRDLFLRRSAYLFTQVLKRLGFGDLVRSLPLLKKTYAMYGMPRNFDDVSLLQSVAKHPLYGLMMYKALSRSRVGLNIHAEIAGKHAANIRIFEVTGVGSCLLTDYKENLGNFFDLESEIVTFRSFEECVEKARWLVDHPKEAEEIARRGQQRVLRDHTLRQRVEQLHGFILKNLK